MPFTDLLAIIGAVIFIVSSLALFIAVASESYKDKSFDRVLASSCISTTLGLVLMAPHFTIVIFG